MDSPARLAIWASGTWRAPFTNLAKDEKTRTIAMVGVERRIPLAVGSWGALELAPAVLPGVYTNGNVHVVGERPCGVFEVCPVMASYATYGMGLLPLAFRAESAPLRQARLRTG